MIEDVVNDEMEKEEEMDDGLRMLRMDDEDKMMRNSNLTKSSWETAQLRKTLTQFQIIGCRGCYNFYYKIP